MQPRDGHCYFVLVCGFFETVTVTGARLYVLAVIEHASGGGGGRILGATGGFKRQAGGGLRAVWRRGQ